MLQIKGIHQGVQAAASKVARIRRNESVRHRRRSVLSSVGVALAAISRDFTYIKQKQACVCMCFSVKRESLSTTSKFTAHVRKRHVLEVVREARELGAQHICIICIICMATIWPTNLETVMEKRHALGGARNTESHTT